MYQNNSQFRSPRPFSNLWWTKSRFQCFNPRTRQTKPRHTTFFSKNSHKTSFAYEMYYIKKNSICTRTTANFVHIKTNAFLQPLMNQNQCFNPRTCQTKSRHATFFFSKKITQDIFCIWNVLLKKTVLFICTRTSNFVHIIKHGSMPSSQCHCFCYGLKKNKITVS